LYISNVRLITVNSTKEKRKMDKSLFETRTKGQLEYEQNLIGQIRELVSKAFCGMSTPTEINHDELQPHSPFSKEWQGVHKTIAIMEEKIEDRLECLPASHKI